MTHELEEFAPAYERVTATIDWSLETGERFSGPLVIGAYPNDAPDVFMSVEGNRISFPAELIPVVIKQLRRAAAIGKEKS